MRSAVEINQCYGVFKDWMGLLISRLIIVSNLIIIQGVVYKLRHVTFSTWSYYQKRLQTKFRKKLKKLFFVF